MNLMQSCMSLSGISNKKNIVLTLAQLMLKDL